MGRRSGPRKVRERLNAAKAAIDLPHRATAVFRRMWELRWGEEPGENTILRIFSAALDCERLQTTQSGHLQIRRDAVLHQNSYDRFRL